MLGLLSASTYAKIGPCELVYVPVTEPSGKSRSSTRTRLPTVTGIGVASPTVVARGCHCMGALTDRQA